MRHLASAKKSAPTHPHPRSADTPPANAVAGVIAGARGVRVGGQRQWLLPKEASTALQDLIARIVRLIAKPPDLANRIHRGP